MRFYLSGPPEPISDSPRAPLNLAVSDIEVIPDEEIFSYLAKARASLEREYFEPERFLVGSHSYLTLVALTMSHGGAYGPYSRILEFSGRHMGSFDRIRAFGLPVSLDPAKPPSWVQCLSETSIRNATFRHLPANIGVSRGFAADDATSIRSVLESVKLPEERKIILPEEAYAAIAKSAVVTSYWDKPFPTKKPSEWTGTERKPLK